VIRLLITPLLAAAVTLPVVNGPLPGRRVPLSAAARAAGAVEVRQVAATGTGARRLPLLVGRTADRRLCVGTEGFFHCLRAEDAEPVYVVGAFRGAREVRWGALVGLAAPEVAAVAVERQSGESTPVPLRRLPGFPWRAFTFPATGPNGELPFVVDVTSRGGGTRQIDMAWAAAPGTRAGDSVDAPVGEPRPQMAEAKRVALADPRVRALLGSRTRLVAKPARWTSCGRAFLGAGIDVHLFQPIAVNGSFPFVAFDARKRDRAYAEGTLRIRATGVTDFLVQVDLNRGKVVGITPGGENVKVADWKLIGKPTPAGPHDTATCPKGD
jgi:hypothetical protein